MKYLVLLAVLVIAYLYWRNNRISAKHDTTPPTAKPKAAPAQAQDMVQCPVCSVHLPRTDALADANGRLYCSAEHREHAGGR